PKFVEKQLQILRLRCAPLRMTTELRITLCSIQHWAEKYFCQVDCYIGHDSDHGRGRQAIAYGGHDPAGDPCGMQRWDQHDGDDRPAERNGVPGDAAAGRRWADPLAVGTPIDRRCRTAPGAQIL